MRVRDTVPPKEPISLAQWQQFIDNEIDERQLTSRQSGRENRAKKVDVHYSGRTSYAEVEHRMVNFFFLQFQCYFILFYHYFALLTNYALFYFRRRGVALGVGHIGSTPMWKFERRRARIRRCPRASLPRL